MQTKAMSALRPRSWPRDRLGHVISIAFLVAAFAISAKVFYYLFTEEITTVATGPERQTSTQTAGNHPIYLLLWGSLYLWVLARLAVQALGQGLHPVLLRGLPFGVLVMASALWSVSPPRTLLHGTMLVFNIAIAYILSQSIAPRMFLLILRRTLIVLMLLSLILMALVPETAATHRFDGAWLSDREMRGVFPFKTDAGWLFGLLFVLIFWSRDWQGSFATRLAMGATTLFAVLLSNSATGLACAILVIAILAVTRLAPHHVGPVLRGIFVLLVVISLTLPFIDVGPIASLLGRDPELTGRVPIWLAAPKFIAERPILGYGYGGFFDTIPSSPVWEFWANNKDAQAAHFHSTAVEILIALGVAGLAAYLWLLWSGFTIVYNRSIVREDRLLLGSVLIFFLVGAAADTTFMAYNSYVTTVLFYCVFAAGTQYPPEPDTVVGGMPTPRRQ